MPKQDIWPKGLKKTKHRETIYNLFVQSDTPLSIVDIQQKLLKEDEQIWLSTIYRILDSFEEHDLIHKLQVPNSELVLYELKTHGHVHYALCTQCKKVIELKHCPMDVFESELSQNHFNTSGHRMEIYGICKDCQH